MKVAIDVRPIQRQASRYRGIGLYTSQFCNALLQRNASTKLAHSFTVLTSDAHDIWNGRASVRRVPVIRRPSRLQWIVDRWTLPRALKRGGLDVFHATEFASIPVCDRTKVIAHV